MRLHVQSLPGNGFLVVSGEVPLAVTYNIDVFVTRAELADGSAVDGQEIASGRVVSNEPRSVAQYIGQRATLQLDPADGAQPWDCLVVNTDGRLEHRGDEPFPWETRRSIVASTRRTFWVGERSTEAPLPKRLNSVERVWPRVSVGPFAHANSEVLRRRDGPAPVVGASGKSGRPAEVET